MRPLKLLFFVSFLLLLLPTLAYAGVDPKQPHNFALPPDQLWALIAGAVVALPTYAINKYAPYTDSKIKGVVHLITAAIAGGITQAITAGDVGFNSATLQFVVAAVVGVIGVQAWWERTGIGPAVGQGQNAQDNPAR